MLESTLGEDVEIGTIEGIRRMMQTLEDHYGRYTVEKGEANFFAITKIPAFTSAESITDGLIKLEALYKERRGWDTATEKFDYPDRGKKEHLI